MKLLLPFGRNFHIFWLKILLLENAGTKKNKCGMAAEATVPFLKNNMECESDVLKTFLAYILYIEVSFVNFVNIMENIEGLVTRQVRCTPSLKSPARSHLNSHEVIWHTFLKNVLQNIENKVLRKKNIF